MTRIAPGWLRAPSTARVMRALAPIQPRFVGGCVRDALLDGADGTVDIDIAVAARPEETMRLAEAGGLGAHPTGLAHGVVTITSAGRGFEVASMRRDVATDGRRAVVSYTDDIAADAARRDFTMNALYADAEGRVIDPLGGGLADVRARRIRFVGAPAERIMEDYLRILRFFRFHATLGIDAFDPAGRAAAIDAAAGLAQVSKERIGAEMLKLLGAPDPEPALKAMGPVLGVVLPGAAPFHGLVAAERNAGEAPDPLRRLAALNARAAESQLRLSRADAARLRGIRAALATPAPPAARAYRRGADAARDALLIEAADGAPPPAGWRVEIARGAAATLPVAAADLIAAGAVPGPALGARLEEIESLWIESDFRATRAELLAGDQDWPR